MTATTDGWAPVLRRWTMVVVRVPDGQPKEPVFTENVFIIIISKLFWNSVYY